MAFVELFGEKLISKSGEVNTTDVLNDKKHVMIYFSAHWCPPCRGFTPQLAQAYQDSEEAGKTVAVVFVSSDRDASHFQEYYNSMPWLALPFQSDFKEKLSSKYGVRGIPCLVVLDGQGNLVTDQGRAQYKTYLPPSTDAGKKQGSAFVELFGEKLVSKSGEANTDDVLKDKKHVMIYFSAHWCPPCRGFTPQLAQAYQDSEEAGKSAAVVFVSSDQDASHFQEYYNSMPWHALPFQSDFKEKLSSKYGVRGIPCLVVLDGQGNLLTDQGRAQYQTYLPPNAVRATGADAANGSRATGADGANGQAVKTQCCTIC